MENDRIELGVLFLRMWSAVTSAWFAVFAYLAVTSIAITIIYLWIGPKASGALLLENVITFIAGYLLLRAMLHRTGLKKEGEGGGFGVYFGVGFLSGLGIVLGLVVLIVPGLVLWVRWLPAISLALSEDEGATESLSQSWAMTRGSFWPLLAAALIGIAGLVLPFIALGTGEGLAQSASLRVDYVYQGSLFAENVVGAIFSVYWTALSVGAYWLLRGERRELSEVFT